MLSFLLRRTHLIHPEHHQHCASFRINSVCLAAEADAAQEDYHFWECGNEEQSTGYWDHQNDLREWVLKQAIANYTVTGNEGRRMAPFRRKREDLPHVDGTTRQPCLVTLVRHRLRGFQQGTPISQIFGRIPNLPAKKTASLTRGSLFGILLSRSSAKQPFQY